MVERVARRRSEAVLEWTSRPMGKRHFGLLLRNNLIQSSERWRKVSFSAPYQALVPVAQSPTFKIPLLEYLSLGPHLASGLPLISIVHPFVDNQWSNETS